MDRKDFESLLNKYPDCVSDGKKLKAFLKDLYPDVPKAIVNTLTIMADDGIISEMQMSIASSSLVSARLQKNLKMIMVYHKNHSRMLFFDYIRQCQTTTNNKQREISRKYQRICSYNIKISVKERKFSKKYNKIRGKTAVTIYTGKRQDHKTDEHQFCI